MSVRGLSRAEAVLWGGFAAGSLDLTAIFVIWDTVENVPPLVILQAIATAFMGDAAFQAGTKAALLGLVLHFFVSFCFAAAYVAVAGRVELLKKHPFIFGPAYGIVAYVFMTYVVVPLSLATFGRPETLLALARSVLIHMYIFALPIAFAASRMRR